MAVQNIHFLISLLGTKAEIEALTGLQQGSRLAYATDTDELGTFDGSAWHWGQLDAIGGGLPNPFALTADITPPELSADVNDYAPTGGATADVWRISTDGSPYNITGIAGGADGRILTLINVDTYTQDITIVANSASSTAGNRIESLRDIVLQWKQAVTLIYDATSSRWRFLANSDARSIQGVQVELGFASIGDQNMIFYNAPSGELKFISRAAYIFSDTEGDPAAIGPVADGTSTFAARRDHVHATTNGSAVLGSAFTLNAASGTYQDTGLSVTLPSAGTYKITANARGSLKGSTGSIWFIVAKLHNSTDAADVANSERMVILTGAAAIDAQNTGALDAIVTVAASKTIKLYAARLTDGTFTLSEISSDSNGRTTLMYEKIG